MTRRIALSSVALVLGLAVFVPGIGTRAQDEGPVVVPPTNEPPSAEAAANAGFCPRAVPAGPTRAVAGFLTCQRCHANGLPRGGFTLLGRTVKYDNEVWSLYGELQIWAEQDRHVQAYAVLHGDRSQKMGEILGVPYVEADGRKVYQIHRDKRCLACHTGFPLSLMQDDDTHASLVADGVEANNEVKYGITCEGCHGGAGNAIAGGAEGWLNPHQITPTNATDGTAWRYLAPGVKAERYGYVDVRSPVARTRMCLSCHLGNAAEGRVVTHEMYAAGHPVLPGFEIESFVRQLPEHWKPFPDKDSGVRKDFLEKTEDHLFQPDYHITNLHNAKSMLVAALVTVAESMRLNAELASDVVAGPVEKGNWPELSQFDCFACHHDLEDGAWRFRRQPVLARPGRPVLREWPAALLAVATRIVERRIPQHRPKVDKLNAALATVADSVGRHPYGGEADEFATRSCVAAKAADELAVAFESHAFPYDEARSLLRDVAAVATDDETLWDYDSARQLVWAFDTILAEVALHRTRATRDGNADWPELSPLPNAETLAKLSAEFGPADSTAADRLLTLDLRLSRTRKVHVKGEDLEINEVSPVERLLPIRNYDPLVFRAVFKRIAAALE